MSKTKGQRSVSSADMRQTQTNNAVKKKKKHRKSSKRNVKDTNEVSSQQTLPPKDAQLFSANWKVLQQILKASQTVTGQNDVVKKEEVKEKTSKTVIKNKVSSGQTESVKTTKHKAVNSSGVCKDSETRQPPAPKRKKDDTSKLNGEEGAKKKKNQQLVVEETKPTEDDIWFDDVDPDDIEATVGAEAAEVMRRKLGLQKGNDPENVLVKERAFEGLTRAVAIDCEMVGVGPDGDDSILARVSLVNQFGKCIYDKFVKPTEKVMDYRTAVSGIRPQDIKDGENIQTVRREVAEILRGRVVVGHAIHNDLKILLLDHPRKNIRDTQKYKPFRKAVKSGRPSLKLLCREILHVRVQQGEHSSVQDAQATMRLYTLVKKQWEAEIKASKNNKDSEKKKERKPKSPQVKGKRGTGL